MLKKKQLEFKEILKHINNNYIKNNKVIDLYCNGVIITDVSKIVWVSDYLKIYKENSYRDICIIKMNSFKKFEYSNDYCLYNEELHLFN